MDEDTFECRGDGADEGELCHLGFGDEAAAALGDEVDYITVGTVVAHYNPGFTQLYFSFLFDKEEAEKF